MSTLYPDLDFTNYPGSLDNLKLKSNITSASDAQLVENIQSAILRGDFDTASTILNNNPQLNGKIFAANDYNKIRDAVIALERFYKNDINNYIQTKQTEWESNIDKFKFIGTFSPSTQYYKNNMVNYSIPSGTFLYLCIEQPSIGTIPTNTTYWRRLTVSGERGVSGAGLSFTFVWDYSMNYNTDDVAVYNGAWWIATQPNQAQIPSEGSSYWEKMLTALPALQIPVQSQQPTNQILGDQWYQAL